MHKGNSAPTGRNLMKFDIWVFFYILSSNSYRENPNKMQQCIKIVLFLILNEAQHVSCDTPPIIRSLKLHKQPLNLHTWKVVGRAVVGRCRVRYPMMGGVSPETCWASFKIRNNTILIHCCILLGCWNFSPPSQRPEKFSGLSIRRLFLWLVCL
jgi:hypothetical protein